MLCFCVDHGSVLENICNLATQVRERQSASTTDKCYEICGNLWHNGRCVEGRIIDYSARCLKRIKKNSLFYCQKAWETCIMRICWVEWHTKHRHSDEIKNEMRRGMWCTWGRRQMHKGFWWGTLKERDHEGDTGVDGRIRLKWIFNKYDERAWAGLKWIRIRTSGRLLWTKECNFGLYKIRSISEIAAKPLATQVESSCN